MLPSARTGDSSGAGAGVGDTESTGVPPKISSPPSVDCCSSEGILLASGVGDGDSSGVGDGQIF
jgi:hypothetical protein